MHQAIQDGGCHRGVSQILAPGQYHSVGCDHNASAQLVALVDYRLQHFGGTLSRELALDALLMAVWRRKPVHRVIVRSDQGSQFGSDDFKRFCAAHNLEPSMSRRRNCWDSAVAESFFSSLKKERNKKRFYKTRDLARADIFDYIEVFYNRSLRHSHLGGISPEAFERAAA